MLAGQSDYRDSNANPIDAATAEFIIHESGTNVYDRYGAFLGEFPTESEALETVREISEH